MNDVRTFLVVVDNSEEMRAALRFACRRARNTDGKVALLHITGPAEFHHFAAIGDLMRQEAREESERLMQRLASEVHSCSGQFPVLHMREGKPDEELLKQIEEDPSISILVLAAGTGKEGPGPLISALTGKKAGKLRIPFTVVPGNLTEEEIDNLA